MTDQETSSLRRRLEALGFKAGHALVAGDFRLRDDADGDGAYIAEWTSDKPCPFPELLRIADEKT